MGMPAKIPLEKRGPFAQWLVERMGRLGLDNKTMAKQVGTTVGAVIHWRTGRNWPMGGKLYLLSVLLDTNEQALRRLIGESRCQAKGQGPAEVA